MKTSTLHTLVASGLMLTPTLMWAQASTTTPAPVNSQAGRGETAGQPSPNAGTQTNADTRGTAAQGNTTNRDATNREDSRREEAKRDREQENKANANANTTANPTASSTREVSRSSQEEFRRLDTNSDVRISPEEFARFSQVDPNPARDASSSTGVGRNGTGPGTPGSTTGSTGGVTGRANDADRESVKSKSANERFVILDVNKDGYLSIEEFDQAAPVNPDVRRDASNSTGAGRNGTGGGTPGSTTGSTGGTTGDADEKAKAEKAKDTERNER